MVDSLQDEESFWAPGNDFLEAPSKAPLPTPSSDGAQIEMSMIFQSSLLRTSEKKSDYFWTVFTS